MKQQEGTDRQDYSRSNDYNGSALVILHDKAEQTGYKRQQDTDTN